MLAHDSANKFAQEFGRITAQEAAQETTQETALALPLFPGPSQRVFIDLPTPN